MNGPLALSATDKLGRAHTRLAKMALVVYLGAAGVALSLFLLTLLSDRTYGFEQTKNQLLLATEAQAFFFGQRIGFLVREIERLEVRSEIDLTDQTLEPERSLLEGSHEHSVLFNLGTAILDRDGTVLWSQPGFLPRGSSFGTKPWFMDARDHASTMLIPVDPSARGAELYVLAPIVRNGRFTGALVGGLDLTREHQWLGQRAGAGSSTQAMLLTSGGAVVYPGVPPLFATRAEWREMFRARTVHPGIRELMLEEEATVVALAPLPLGDLVFASVVPRRALYDPVARRFASRLLLGLTLTLIPLGTFILLLRRSIVEFRSSEQDAMREDRLKRTGEASNLIAHEVRNSLNGLRMGLDLVLREKKPASERVVRELRNEIEKLADFTHQLMLFAKDSKLRLTRIDLADLVPKWLGLARDLGQELAVDIDVAVCPGPVSVQGDPVLLQIAVGNLTSNALDALSTVSAPRLSVTLERARGEARLRVRDNGAGVPREVRINLFEPFVTGKPSGVGLGLALARKIARAHAGDLLLERTASGASFLLTLPLEET